MSMEDETDSQTNKQLDKFWQLLFERVPRFGTKIASSAQYILAAVMSSQERRFIPSDVVPILEDWSDDPKNCPCTVLGIFWTERGSSLRIKDDTITIHCLGKLFGVLSNDGKNRSRVVKLIIQSLNDNPVSPTASTPHSEQPTVLCGKIVRFKHNRIVQMLLETSTRWDYYALLESFRGGDLSLEDWLQFNQLIGSTLTAYEEATLEE